MLRLPIFLTSVPLATALQLSSLQGTQHMLTCAGMCCNPWHELMWVERAAHA